MILGLLAILLTGAPVPAPPPEPPTLFTYRIEETSRSVTPSGERVRALKGSVLVSDGRARWDLGSKGTLPRSTATSALADRDGVVLLDRAEKLSAKATPAEFQSLFLGKPGELGLASFVVRDLQVSARREGDGSEFQGMPTARYRVTLEWTLLGTMPGRVSIVKNEVRAEIDTLAGWDDARSLFDELTRLFPARGDALDALSRELQKIQGFPVRAEVQSTAEATYEPTGMPQEPPEVSRPVRSSTSAVRKISNLSRSRARPEDAVLLSVPEEYRTRGLERLLKESPELR